MAIVKLLTNYLVLIFLLAFANTVDFADARAFFVFGDSLVDNGNNNYLPTTARADAPPYGIDYPTHKPTGRFSNGFNIPDLIGEKLGLKPIYPYLAPELQGEKLLLGANFASAGVGILNDTGIQFINIIRVDRQLQFFGEYQAKVRAIIGAENTTKLIDESLVLITLGGNDFVNNYYLVPYSLRSIQFPLQEYCTYLVSEYRKVLKSLYDLGARHVVVTGTGPLGCTPAERALRGSNGECAEELQKAAFTFNPKLIAMLSELNKQLGKDVFIGANTNPIHLDFIKNPKAFGFETSENACCGQGPYNGIGLCTALSNLCPNREVYVFWDAFHPTEKAIKLIVEEMFNGSTKSMSPMNLSTLKAMYF